MYTNVIEIYQFATFTTYYYRNKNSKTLKMAK